MRRPRVIHLFAMVCFIAAGCSAEGGNVTTTADVATTTADTTTTSAPTPTTQPTDTNDLASGSGCKPGSVDSLPDGEWYGFIVDVDESAAEFDLACWFTGDAAEMAASEDGAESPPPNDYYVRNESEAPRTLAVGSSAEVEYLTNSGDPTTEATSSYAEWSAEWEIDEFVPGYWVTVEDGVVTQIVQQYVP